MDEQDRQENKVINNAIRLTTALATHLTTENCEHCRKVFHNLLQK